MTNIFPQGWDVWSIEPASVLLRVVGTSALKCSRNTPSFCKKREQILHLSQKNICVFREIFLEFRKISRKHEIKILAKFSQFRETRNLKFGQQFGYFAKLKWFFKDLTKLYRIVNFGTQCSSYLQYSTLWTVYV